MDHTIGLVGVRNGVAVGRILGGRRVVTDGTSGRVGFVVTYELDLLFRVDGILTLIDVRIMPINPIKGFRPVGIVVVAFY